MNSTPDGESDLAKSEALLRQAAQATDMAERGRLIDEAAWWRFRGMSPDGNPSVFALEDELAGVEAVTPTAAARAAS